MSVSKDQASAWVRTVSRAHLASNCREYRWAVYVAQRSNSSALGFQVDLKPAEGKIVDESEEYVLMKTSRTEFFVAAKESLSIVPEVGSVCRITPYARRLFDGTRLDAPIEENCGTYVTKIYHMGAYKSPLPIDKEKIACFQFRDMINVIESERADSIRTISQVLIDAGALAEPIFCQDVIDEEDIIDKPPTLRFAVCTSKHTGYVEIRYDRAGDCFTVLILNGDMTVLSCTEQVYIAIDGPSNIGQIIIDAVDDGAWKIAPVAILKKAPARKAVAA